MKKLNPIFLSITLILLCVSSGYTQENTVNFEVKTTKATLLGKSKPIKQLIQLSATSPEKKKGYKREKTKPANFPNRRGRSNSIISELEHQGPDPIRQWDSRNLKSIVEPIVNIDGIGNFGSPHDPTGDIGIDYYVQAVNVTEVGVFTKEGVLVEQFAMNTLWSEFNGSSAGDPIILFDETASRWVITEFTDPANLLIAISVSSDPLGSYYAYSFSTPNFPDYPKYGIWPDAYTVTTNEGGPGTLHQYFLDRNAMLNGEADVTIQRVGVMGNNNTEAGFFVSTPVDWNGAMMPVSNNPIVLALNDSSWGAVSEDAIDMYTFDVNFEDPDATTVVNTRIAVTPYDSYPCSVDGFGFSCVPQPNGTGLDAIPEVIMNVPHYRNFGTHESLVLCFVTDVTDGENLSGIRWTELRKTPETDWALYQEGTYAPDDGLDRYMCSIAIDKNGNIGLGFNVSSEEEYVGVRYTGRFASDPLGMMTIDEYNVVTGSATITSFGRFGDYPQMSVDPVDGSTFWFNTEYAGGGQGGSRTRLVAFQLQKDTIDLAVTGIINPKTSSALGASETVEIQVTNAGIDTIAGFDIGFELDNVFVGSKMIPDTLDPGESANFTFDQTIDLSMLGEYLIKGYVSYSLDSNQVNDTLVQIVSKIIDLDASIEAVAPNSSCDSIIFFEVSISNIGDVALTSANINIYINGVLNNTIPWTGSVALGASVSETLSLSDLPIGDHIIEVTITEPNGDMDLNTDNDSSQFDLTIQDSAGAIFVNLFTDEYPGETTYVITDIETGEVLVEGGPFLQELTEESLSLCLSADACYEFTIFDSYGDGICCDYGNGNYSIVDIEGNTLISGNGEFGNEETNRFCPGVICMITAEIFTTPASGANSNDGTILINAKNGTGPFSYSIDGGNTFSKSNMFNMVAGGPYEIVVQDMDGICTYSESIIVDIISATDNVLSDELSIIIAPNPSDGYFTLTLSHLKTNTHAMDIQVLNAQGQIIQTRKIQKYDQIFETTISLIDYPNGEYFIRYLDPAITKMSKVVKTH